MGMSNYWLDQQQKIFGELDKGTMDEVEATKKLESLGMDPAEAFDCVRTMLGQTQHNTGAEASDDFERENRRAIEQISYERNTRFLRGI